jgi:flagellar assembly protein FliH
VERSVIDIILQITRKVLDRDVQARPEVALRVLRSALIAVADQEIVAIRVAPDFIATFRHGVSALGDVVADPEGVSWIPDRRVPVGGAVIETENGKIDATIDVQVDEAARVLRDVLDGQDA